MVWLTADWVTLLIAAKSQNTFKLSICINALNTIMASTSNMNQSMNRRQFLGTTAIAGAGVTLSLSQAVRAQNAGLSPGVGAGEKPALLGGKPVRTKPLNKWPVIDEREEI